MTALWATLDVITAAKLNKSFNSGLDADKGTPTVVGEAYIATDTNKIYYSLNGSTWEYYLMNNLDKSNLIQLIQQMHPTLQVLAAMDTTSTDLDIDDTIYYLPTSNIEYDDHNDNIVTESKWTVTVSGGTVTEITNSDMRIYSYLWAPSGVNSAKVESNTSLSFPLYIYISTATGNNTWYLVTNISIRGSTSGSAAVNVVAGTNYLIKVTTDGAGNYTIKNLKSGSSSTAALVGTPILQYYTEASGTNSNNGPATFNVNVTGYSALIGNIISSIITADAAILSFYKQLKMLVSNGASTHATPVQAEIYGNANSYASPLNATTKFTIDPTDPRIILKRDGLDTITASSASQTVWNMTVAGGMAALPNHGTILATEIGVASILMVEKSILGDWTDTVVFAENTDYVVDYSTRTATKVTLTSGTGIVNAQSKLRFSWIADVMKIDGATNNTALKTNLFLNRTAASETSPSIQLIPLGSAKYCELLYGT